MRISRRSFIAGALAAYALPARAAAGTTLVTGPAFGAGFRAVIADDFAPDSVRAGIVDVVDSIDRQMSPFRPDSALARFNAGGRGTWFALEAEFRAALGAALDLARRSGGAFDPTVGSTVGRYGFGPIHGSENVSHADVEFDGTGVRKLRGGVTLDLCGIAKGHALDCIFSALAAQADAGMLVELGGEIRAAGRHPSGRAWQAGIEHAASDGLACIVDLDGGAALATSGDRVNSYRAGDRIYSHIIDGRRRTPADAAVASVSVIAGRASEADGLATALCALGHRDGPAFAEAEGIAALFQIREAGRLRLLMSATFRERLLWSAET